MEIKVNFLDKLRLEAKFDRRRTGVQSPCVPPIGSPRITSYDHSVWAKRLHPEGSARAIPPKSRCIRSGG